MPVDVFMPVGRTSLVKRGAQSFHVQTEYAARPYPRLTTSVLLGGQLVHKVEKKLDCTVASQDEQRHAEATMVEQHNDIVTLIGGKPPEQNHISDAPPPVEGDRSLYQRLAELPGLQHIYRLSADGAFVSATASAQFKKTFPEIFKNLSAVVDVLPCRPGKDWVRQRGFYEVQRNRLYFVSAANQCYFVEIRPNSENVDYESALKVILAATGPAETL
ncbi:MAG TPA: hypothetical protein VN285_05700 [Candidatus Deferrimicrobium sp.]|nr:hypothetical protein [Candidatus Deferrimicrobium sp.]